MRTTADIYAEMVATTDSLSPVPTRLDRYESVESAALFAIAEALYRTEQALQIIRDSTSADTATDGALTQIAREVGITRREASRSRYTVGLSFGQSGTLEGGEILRSEGQVEWRVLTTGPVTWGVDPILIEAVEPGATTLSDPAGLLMVTSTPGITAMQWSSGITPAPQVGQARETDAQLAVRIAQGGSGPRSRVLDLDWITLADLVTTGAGAVTLTIGPGPSGTDQEAELADAIGPSTYGVTYSGTAGTVTYAPEGATPVTIGYDVADLDPIAVAVTVTTASGVTLADVSTGVEAAILAYATTLGPGDDAIRARVIAAALTVEGVEDVTVCTLDGNATNHTPSPLSYTVSFSSVTVS